MPVDDVVLDGVALLARHAAGAIREQLDAAAQDDRDRFVNAACGTQGKAALARAATVVTAALKACWAGMVGNRDLLPYPMEISVTIRTAVIPSRGIVAGRVTICFRRYHTPILFLPTIIVL